MINLVRNTDKFKISLRDVRLTESDYMTTTKMTTEQNLKSVLSNDL